MVTADYLPRASGNLVTFCLLQRFVLFVFCFSVCFLFVFGCDVWRNINAKDLNSDKK